MDSTENHWNGRGAGQLLAGVILIALGVLFLLDKFHLLAFTWTFRTWWPLLLILFGVAQFFTHRRRRWVGPLVMITIGAIFLGQNLDWRSWWEMRNLWPVILIAVGVGILFSRLQGRHNLPNGAEAKS